MFKGRTVNHAAEFTNMLEEIAKYIQVKYNSDMAWMIEDVEHLEFDCPEHPIPWFVTKIEIYILSSCIIEKLFLLKKKKAEKSKDWFYIIPIIPA